MAPASPREGRDAHCPPKLAAEEEEEAVAVAEAAEEEAEAAAMCRRRIRSLRYLRRPLTWPAEPEMHVIMAWHRLATFTRYLRRA